MEIYLQLDFLTRETLLQALNTAAIGGLALGREFCPRRETDLEDANFEDIAMMALNRGKKLILNTPVYLTTPEFSRLTTRIRSLLKNGIAGEIRLHDWGLLSALRGSASLCWDSWGLQRTFPGADLPFSRPWFEFLSGQGVGLFELPWPYYRILASRGEELPFPWRLKLGSHFPVSFSRHCYSRVLTGENCEKEPPCRRKLLLKPQESPESGFPVRGHTLLKPNRLPPKISFTAKNSPQSVLLSAEDWKEARNLLKKLAL